MIALLLLIGIALWVTFSIKLARRIPGWLKVTRYKRLVSTMAFFLILIVPWADALIGFWQFEKLCEQNVMHLSLDWQNVKRAKNVSPDHPERQKGYVTRVQKWESKYQDIDSGKIFLHYNSYYNYGGFLMDNLGLALSGAPQECRPKNYDLIRKKIHLQQLLDQGK